MLSFADRFDAGVSALGVELSPLAFDLAKMKWDNPNDFETVLNLLTNNKEGTTV
jgi:hypothetical protein